MRVGLLESLPALVLAGLNHRVRAAADGLLDAYGDLTVLPIIQRRFPEVAHTALAIDGIHHAVEATDAKWTGHLAMGGGPVIGADGIDAAGSQANHQAAALKAVAEAHDGLHPTLPCYRM